MDPSGSQHSRPPCLRQAPSVQVLQKASEHNVRGLFRLETGLDNKDSLPPELLSKEVCSRILKQTADYESGDVLICRSYLKIKRAVYHVNYEYTGSRVDGAP